MNYARKNCKAQSPGVEISRLNGLVWHKSVRLLTPFPECGKTILSEQARQRLPSANKH
jgi:hypothetical protein